MYESTPVFSTTPSTLFLFGVELVEVNDWVTGEGT